MNQPIIIVGAGGHAAVLADALLATGVDVLGFTSLVKTSVSLACGLPILGDDSVLQRWVPESIRLVNGIGTIDTRGLRRRVQESLEKQGWRFVGVQHPTATVSRFATLAEDVQLLAHSVVQPGARVERGCIINTSSVVEHHASLGAFVHVAPRAVICGEATIGADSHVGAGAIIRQQVRLGTRTLVGIGAAVVRDYAGEGCVMGVPAREHTPHLERNE